MLENVKQLVYLLIPFLYVLGIYLIGKFLLITFVELDMLNILKRQAYVRNV